MPKFTSEKQRRAFYAASEGKSNIGIPKDVAKQAVKEDQAKPAKNLPETAPSQKNKSKDSGRNGY